MRNIESGCPDESRDQHVVVTSQWGGAHARFIASANYPDRYFRDAECLWQVATQSTQRLRLTLVDFELDVRRAGVCHDQLTIISQSVDGSHHVIFSDCGALGKQVMNIINLM